MPDDAIPPKPLTYHAFALWRFLAALIIMFYHFVHLSDDWRTWVPWLENMLPLLDLFFMVSGFLIYERYQSRLGNMKSFMVFLYKRLARLYPLHLITTLFFVALGVVWEAGLIRAENGPVLFDWSALPANFLLLQAWGTTEWLSFNFPSWSLSAEWLCYLLMPLVVLVATRSGIAGLIFGAVLAYMIALFVIAQGWSPAQSVAEMKNWGAFRAVGSFFIGAALVRIVHLTTFKMGSHLAGQISMAFTVWLMFQPAAYGLVLTALAATLWLAALAERDNPHGMAWMRPGLPVLAVSFGIYLWHPVLEAIYLKGIWRIIEPIVDFRIDWLFIPAAISTIVVALVSHVLFEKPIGDWLIDRLHGRKIRHALAARSALMEGGR
ncbi:acyltransferase [Notoacmeibacter sp. MSK16QG-6]|uniref:acyltransferase family protein n=1 Tax=Notoacmeibacter sp. MSK16QG-6 TaxID=2957982 RepID=UPI00209D4F78|nr:acyltransferase [Notoacmeibacter sp. MSK16QG-6]MCP1198937.1 acyltransferase [Notoacmeibacter sp. MSK16QG-6]